MSSKPAQLQTGRLMDCSMPAPFFHHTDYFFKIQCKALPSGGVSIDEFQNPERCGKPGSAVLGLLGEEPLSPCSLSLSRVAVCWTLGILQFSVAHSWMEDLKLVTEL